MRLANFTPCLTALLFLCLPASAVDKLWQTDNGDYNVDANWNPAGVPNNDDALIVDGKTANLTTTPPPGHQLYVGATFDHGATTAGGGTLNQTGGDLHLAGNQSWMVVADLSGITATYNLSGGSLLIDDDYMTIGQNGNGALNVSGTGSINTKGLIFGRWNPTAHGSRASGAGTLAGGGSITTRENGFVVGRQGDGVFTQNGGTVTSAPGDFESWTFVGREAGSVGTYNMNAGTLTAGTRIQVGQDRGSTGTFNLSGGTVTVGNNMSVGDSGTGTVDVSGGTLNVNNEGLIIGAWRDTGPAATPPNPPNVGGNGTLKVSGTGVINAANLRLGRGSPQTVDQPNGGIYNTGVVQQTGGTVNVATEVSIGTGNVQSVGTYTQSGGTLNAGQFRIAMDGATGTYNLSGTGVVRQNDVADIGNGGTWNYFGGGGAPAQANFNISGGTASFDARTMMAVNPGANATVTQTGGVFEVRRGEFVIGDQSTAVYNISGGTLRTLNPENGNPDTAGHITVGQWDNSNGRLQVSGTALVEAAANLQLADGQVSAPNAGAVVQTGGTVRVGVAGAGNLTMARTASGTASYDLQGGVLDLTGGSIVKGDGVATFTMTGGTLQGVDSMNMPLTQAGGKLSVGNGVGRTTINNSYTLGAPGVLEMQLNGPGAATDYDQLVVTGPITLSGVLSILNGFDAPDGTQFLILDNQGTAPIVGNFLGLPEGAVFSAGPDQYKISYVGGNGNDVVLTAGVPEPSTLGVVALAMAGLLGTRRSRRACAGFTH
jgi:fibronectin-binding autotransporter adhesin